MKNEPDTKETLSPQEREQLKKIVLARLSVMPADMTVTIGSDSLTKESIAEHVQSEDEIGKQMMDIELEYLRDLASGAVYGQ